MSEENARDPYLGLNEHLRRCANEQIKSHYKIGTVISIDPLIIRSDGFNLDKTDLMIAQHLKAGFTESLINLAWDISADLPVARFTGTCACSAGAGTAEVMRPRETVRGKTAAKASITHERPLSVEDVVLLIPSDDAQIYYVVDKLVEVDS